MKIPIYLVTYNSSLQFKATIDRHLTLIDKDHPLFVIDNSNDESVVKLNYQTVNEVNRQKGHHVATVLYAGTNFGIGGARKLAAKHFHETGASHMIYLEDDFVYIDPPSHDRCGFTHHVNMAHFWMWNDDLLQKCKFIDYFKYSFSEVFGNNNENWAYKNFNQTQKESFQGDPDFSQFRKIDVIMGQPIALGDVYYCNWPHLISQRFSKLMFTNTTTHWEGHWMAQSVLLQQGVNLQCGIVLGSMFLHDRRYNYDIKTRSEG